LLLGLYKEDEDGGERMKFTKVTELHLYKLMSRDSQREYLVAHIIAPDGAKAAYIAFERHSCLRNQTVRRLTPLGISIATNPHPLHPRRRQVHIDSNSHSQQPLSPSSSLESFTPSGAAGIVRVLDKPKLRNDDVFLGKHTFND
jgi:hypothetical protein